MIDGLTVARVAFARTVRLVSTANRRPAILASLVADEDLEALSEIEGATSARLLAQDTGLAGIDAHEFVFGVPHAKFINAAFAYSRPRELNRFNGPDRGAWYAALDVETCLAEVVFHMAGFLDRSGRYDATVEYVELYASLAGEYVDLRDSPGAPCLDSDPSLAHPLGNALADTVRARGYNGLIYPSARHPDGTCIAALWPHAVQSVAQGACWRIQWSGSPVPVVTAV